MIELSGVSVTVPVPGAGPKTLLHDVTLTLAEQRIALIGANGSGKSTLLRLLNGLILPTTGQVLVDGHCTKRAGREVRSRVGFVFTDPLSQLVMSTPADDLELSLRRRIKDRAERRRVAVQLLADRGLGGVCDQSIYDLSGGERQLVSLATVLAVQPQVVVADEPTTLLDLRNRNQIVTALQGLPQQLIVATHDLDFAATFERILLIDCGRVVADGSVGVIERYRRELS